MPLNQSTTPVSTSASTITTSPSLVVESTGAKIASDVLVGTVAGLVATFLAFFFGRFWRAVIEPWYETRVYKDVKIEGNWTGKILADGVEREVVWELKQVGHSIMALVTPLSGPNKGKHHKIEGKFRNLILTVTYHVEDKFALDSGCLSLKLVNNGRQLRGYAIIYNPRSENLETVEYVISRSSTQQPTTVINQPIPFVQPPSGQVIKATDV